MRKIARIFGTQAATVLPAGNPYERQIVFEYAAHYARRDGEVRLDLDGRVWLVRSAARAGGLSCVACNSTHQEINFWRGFDVFCSRCVSDGDAGNRPAWMGAVARTPKFKPAA